MGFVRPRLRALLLVVLVSLTVMALARAGVPAGAQSVEPQPRGTTEATPPPVQRIIPLPNSGHKPEDAGDPGGSLQVLLFVILIVGVSSIIGLALRDIRKAKRRQAAAAATGAPGGQGGGQPSSGP